MNSARRGSNDYRFDTLSYDFHDRRMGGPLAIWMPAFPDRSIYKEPVTRIELVTSSLREMRSAI